MKRNVDLNIISDGKKYGLEDMVRVGCNNCEGCHLCCTGMGDSIKLDPLDVFQLSKTMNQSFGVLMDQYLGLSVIDGVITPNINFTKEDACPFLNTEGRCSVHEVRPGFCRMFPLGRVYEEENFYYILQVNECPQPSKTKIRIRNWLGMDNIKEYEKFVLEWHTILGLTSDIVKKESYEIGKNISVDLLNNFYMETYDYKKAFYIQFYSKLEIFKQKWFIKGEKGNA